jgi:hypothetical protein
MTERIVLLLSLLEDPTLSEEHKENATDLLRLELITLSGERYPGGSVTFGAGYLIDLMREAYRAGRKDVKDVNV